MNNFLTNKNKKKDKDNPKVLFWSSGFILFRNTLIGNLYEISQVYPTILLLGETIDSETEKILHNKKLFPKLQKIIFCEEPFYEKILVKNNHLYRTIKKIIKDYEPDIVVSAEDFYPGSLYLMRLAKKMGSVTIAIQSGFKMAEKEKLYLWSCLVNSYTKMPNFLPFSVRLFFVKLKKYLGHFFYYWILPLTVGEAPFKGKTSFIFWDESSGLRDADYSVVFSQRDYDLCIKDGVPTKKLFILNHPLIRENTKKFFEKTYFSNSLNKQKTYSKILTVMLSAERIGFKRNDYSLIPEKKIQKNKVRIIALVADTLKGWKIFIKPYPGGSDILEIKKIFEPISDCVTVVEPLEPADKYIKMSDVILGVPPASTTLFTASLQRPEKIVLSLDLNNEFLGDIYKDFSGLEYINSEKGLVDALKLIRDNKYCKKRGANSNSGFSDTNELLDYIYTRHLNPVRKR